MNLNPTSLRDDDTFAVEYDALADGCGYHELTDWSVVALTGKDRETFLHNVCTNDIRKLLVGEGCEAFCTDVKGKIVAHVYANLLEDRITLLTVPGQAEGIIAHFDRYIIREDVQLADVSQAEAWFVLAGKRAEELAPSELRRPWQSMQCRVGAVEAIAVNFPLPCRSAYLLATAREQAATLRQELDARGSVVCGEQAWNSLRAESGMPLFGIDFNDSNLPQEVARDSAAISFTKGCYLGQETVARLDALGHVNKQIVTLKFESKATPTPGTALTHNGQPVGTATTVAWSRRFDAPLALGMVRRGSNAAGTRLNSSCGPVEVVATPALG